MTSACRKSHVSLGGGAKAHACTLPFVLQRLGSQCNHNLFPLELKSECTNVACNTESRVGNRLGCMLRAIAFPCTCSGNRRGCSVHKISQRVEHPTSCSIRARDTEEDWLDSNFTCECTIAGREPTFYPPESSVHVLCPTGCPFQTVGRVSFRA